MGRKKYKNSAMRNRYGTYRSRAARLGREFNLSYKEFQLLVLDDCHYCGTKPAQTLVLHGNLATTNGIDRVDNDHGYIHGNVVTCCINCNRAKHTLTYDEYIEYLDGLMSFRRKHGEFKQALSTLEPQDVIFDSTEGIDEGAINSLEG